MRTLLDLRLIMLESLFLFLAMSLSSLRISLRVLFRLLLFVSIMLSSRGGRRVLGVVLLLLLLLLLLLVSRRLFVTRGVLGLSVRAFRLVLVLVGRRRAGRCGWQIRLLDRLMASELGLLLLRLLVLLHLILMLTHAMLFVALTLNSLDLLSQAGVTLLLLFLMTSVLRVTLFLGLCGRTSVCVLLLVLLANAVIGGMVVRLLVVVAVAVALGRGMERRDVKDGTRVLATLLVVVVLALVVKLLRLHLMLVRSSRGGIGSSRVLHELLDWRLVFVDRNRIWLGDSHGNLLVHFHDLGEWHWHVFDHMHGIGDGVRHLHGIGHWHFNGHRFRDSDLLRRQMVLAHVRAQMLQLRMLGVATAAAAATSAVDTSIGHDDAKRGYANDTEDLQR